MLLCIEIISIKVKMIVKVTIMCFFWLVKFLTFFQHINY